MVENNFNIEPTTRLQTPEKSPSHPHPRSSGAPWWLVIVLTLGLAGMATYIAWMNSDTLKNRMGYLAGFMDPGQSEAELVLPAPNADSSAAWENTLLNSGSLAADSVVQNFESSSGTEGENTGSESTQAEIPATGLNEPGPVTAETSPKPVYYIKAGEFTSRRAAQFRISELRQGNYWGRIIEPDSAGGTYIVSVGEFSSFNKAKEKARTIGFIMDIRTSIVKTE